MSSETRMRRFRWFWPWQDGREEAWLAEMSRQSWHLVALPGPALYDFERGEPREYVYRLDFQAEHAKRLGDYRQLFEDAGWTLVGTMSGWHYFRKLPALGETPEIFTDLESKAAKYKRLVTYLGTMVAVMVPISIVLLTDRPVTSRVGEALIVLYFLLLAVAVGILIGLASRVRQLEQ